MLRKTKEKLYPKVLDNYRGSRDFEIRKKRIANVGEEPLTEESVDGGSFNPKMQT